MTNFDRVAKTVPVPRRNLKQPREYLRVLRRADERENAAFLLLERTMRQTRPQIGVLGLKSLMVREGTIERSSLGRLRFRFTGGESDFAPENRLRTRPLSDKEVTHWASLQKLVDETRPVVDPQGNLISMRVGSRVLSRLRLGGVVTFVPNGTSIHGGKPDDPATAAMRRPGRPSPSRFGNEATLLSAIDAFLRERDGFESARVRVRIGWGHARAASMWGDGGLFVAGRGHRHSRSKWHKCPICRMPVARGRFNPRIPVGTVRPGVGSIRDLRGGYLSRLRETYLLEDPLSLLPSPDSRDSPTAETSSKPASPDARGAG